MNIFCDGNLMVNGSFLPYQSLYSYMGLVILSKEGVNCVGFLTSFSAFLAILLDFCVPRDEGSPQYISLVSSKIDLKITRIMFFYSLIMLLGCWFRKSYLQ